MHKTMFLAVAVFALATRAALSNEVHEPKAATAAVTEAAASTPVVPSKPENGKVDDSKTVHSSDPAAVGNNASDPVVTTTTAAPTGGASNAKICTLLVQIASLSLVARHVLLQ